jgi:hypothetical protein
VCGGVCERVRAPGGGDGVSDILGAFETLHTFVLDCFAVMAFGEKFKF